MAPMIIMESMAVYLIHFLREVLGIKVPMVFVYTSSKMMLAAITALVFSIFLGPRFIRLLTQLKIGQTIRKEECPTLGQLHAEKEATPTMGGVLILVSMLIAMFVWMDLKNAFTLLLLLTTVTLGWLGGLDDYLKLKYKNSKGLPGKKKLLCQLVLSSLVAAYLLIPFVSEQLKCRYGVACPVIKEEFIENNQNVVKRQLRLCEYAARVYLPFVKEPVLQLSGILLIFPFMFIIFVITGSSNAVNLTDGLDGLAAGCLFMVAICLATFAFVSNNADLASYLNILYVEGSGEIAIYLSAFAGACLGFLWYNGYPAQVFMGDTGSLALGGVIGVSAVLLKREFLLALVGGIFVAEAFSVILQVASYRYRNKKRLLLCAPLHHHFEYKGWTENKVVIRFWIVAFLLAIIGMASLKFQ